MYGVLRSTILCKRSFNRNFAFRVSNLAFWYPAQPDDRVRIAGQPKQAISEQALVQRRGRSSPLECLGNHGYPEGRKGGFLGRSERVPGQRIEITSEVVAAGGGVIAQRALPIDSPKCNPN
jgi:hypothetical protein